MMYKAWNSIEEVPYCFSRSSVKFLGHTALKVVEFDPNWPFPDSNSSLNTPMATKWCTKLEVALKRCPIAFQGHPSNFKVARLKKIVEFDPNWAFSDCKSSLNSPMATKLCIKLAVASSWRGALLFFKVIRQISRSHGSKNRRIWPKLAVSGL